MLGPPPRSPPTSTLFPYPALFRCTSTNNHGPASEPTSPSQQNRQPVHEPRVGRYANQPEGHRGVHRSFSKPTAHHHNESRGTFRLLGGELFLSTRTESTGASYSDPACRPPSNGLPSCSIETILQADNQIRASPHSSDLCRHLAFWKTHVDRKSVE